MGSFVRSLLFAAPLLLAAPVYAQQTEQSAPGFQLPPANPAPAPDPNRQGPELDVYRDQPRTAPPVVAPTVVPPPVPVQTAPRPQPTPVRPAPTQPAQPRATPPAERATPAPTQPTPTPAEPVQSAEPANESAPVAAPSQLPAPATNAVETPEPAAPAPVVAEADNNLPWIIGGALALVALAAFLLLRRRRPVEEAEEELFVESASAPADVTPPEPAAAPVPTPEPVAAPELPAAEPAAGRPWLDMDMAVSQARYSLMGVTIAYSLILHNRGDRPAQDILIRGIVGNAGASQQALLQGFFSGQDGLPLHSAVSIAPGETRQLAGELRLSPDQIVPVAMGQRSLLIPLAAFDMAYRWEDAQGEPLGHGRTARAFIVGQEQEPPADRLAPLRLDQGPRQYRRPAARAAAELAPA
jgi:MYXO-CTERM domain-containing protein